MNSFKVARLYFILPCIFVSNTILSWFDNPHFYRATNMFSEPRIGKEYLSTFECAISYGKTREGRNRCHSKVPVFDTWGCQNIHELGVNVPGKDLSNPYDIILNQLALIPSRCNFAQISFCGRFKLIEAAFCLTQNICKGFFFEAYLPVRRFEFDNICFNDLSPCDDECPNVETPMWQAFVQNFDTILSRWCLVCGDNKETGVGDLALFLGWTCNNQNTEVLDFIDVTLRVGLITPTGKDRDINRVFSLPFGYGKHIGAPISADFSFGACEWITIGAHVEAIPFAKKRKCVRMKTALCQSGIIKLAKGEAIEDKGTFWTTGAFFKGDHFVRGFSFLMGYSFATKSNDMLCPCDPCTFVPSIVNSDEMLRGWKMHTLNFYAEYDFTQENWWLGPRVGIFYNKQVGGKRVFNTSMFGGAFGLEIIFDF